jgi:hypothetical protein
VNPRWAYFKLQYPLVKRLIENADFARDVQKRVLEQRIRLTEESRFGRDHGFSSIRSLADFRRRVPISDFEYFRPYVDEVREGRTDALFGPKTQLKMFALTSGTTEQPKHIPITDQFLRSYKRGWKIWGLKTHADHMDLLSKHYVHLSSDWQQSQTPGGAWCGNISGLAAETRPAVVRRPFLVPPEIGKISDWSNRQYTALRLAVPSRRVGLIITANPLTLISLAKLADDQKETLLRDLAEGTLTLPKPEVGMTDKRLLRRIRPLSKSRVRELEGIIERTGHLYPRDFWPELSVVAVWMGGPVGAFIPELRELYGECAVRDHGLSASEGRMTIPMQDESSFGILDYETSFYEFIPEDQIGASNPTVLEAHELQEGESYFILMTNPGGLFRYNIRDVVRCVGFQGQAPLLEFLHKGAHCTNIAGEKLTEYQVVTAVKNAYRDLDRNVEPVMLLPVMGSPPHYLLLVEEQSKDIVQQLAERTDAHLCALNCEYDDRIRTRRLRPIFQRVIPTGSWKRLRDQKIASRGGSQEQYKHLFLGSSDEVIHQLGLPPSSDRGIA